ncbi:MAG TPA: BMP family protein [Atopostipes sp.]|nr:BMP family protein [Atopostipes sp.]
MANWKKLAMFGASALLLAACGNGGGTDEGTDNGSAPEDGGEEEQFSIAMVTDTGGVDDRSFNQSAWEGMQEWAEEHGFGDDSVVYYQSEAENDYVPNLNTATTDGHDVIYGIGFLLEDPIATIAEQNPDRMYGIVDSVVEMDNVVSLNFNDHENSFLAGMAAALTTETGRVGFIGGIEGPIIDRFQTGFTHGVEYVDDSIEVDIQYANSFGDTAAGQQIAAAMYSNGADVIFHAAGAVGNGVFQEARNRMEDGSDTQLWVIGVDRDQTAEGEWEEGNLTLGSTIKQVGQAIKLSANEAMEGNFQGGENISYGFAEDGIDFVMHEEMPQEYVDQIEEARQAITDGEIEVREFTYSQ